MGSKIRMFGVGFGGLGALFLAMIVLSGKTSTAPSAQVLSEPPANIRESVKTQSIAAQNKNVGTQSGIKETFSAEWLQEQAALVNDIDPNPSATLERLTHVARQFKNGDIDYLANIVMNTEAGQSERLLSLHLLTLSPVTSSHVLLKIAAMNDPLFEAKIPEHSALEFDRDLAASMALGALDEIQKRAAREPLLIVEMERIAAQTKSRVVRDTAKKMAQAAREGRHFVAEAQ